MQIDKYIENGLVLTGMIANDVRYGKLSHQEIEDLLNDSRIKAAFIDTNLKEKKPMEDWNEQYLDELFGMASMTCFNDDYLFFLEKVTKHVQRKQKAKNIIKKTLVGIGILILVSFIVGKCSDDKFEDDITYTTEVN